MQASFYQIRQCENPSCGLRYPLTEGHPFGERCPTCLGGTRVELERKFSPPSPSVSPTHAGDGIIMEALLDNVRSAWNVGAIFRTADGFGVRRLYLCGITPTPENPSVAKTALGAHESVGWEHHKNALTLVKRLKDEGWVVWALEQDERGLSTDFIADSRITVSEAIVLIVGNEITGVDPALLDLCDRIFHIPMRGMKQSLNVEVAFGVGVALLLAALENASSGKH